MTKTKDVVIQTWCLYFEWLELKEQIFWWDYWFQETGYEIGSTEMYVADDVFQRIKDLN